MWFKRKLVMIPFDVSKRYNCTEGLIVKCIKSWTPIGNSPREVNKLTISRNWSKGVLDCYEAQHLFIVSDEEIKEGDWCINSYDNAVWKYKPSPCPLPYWGNKDTLKKIIATTDTSLVLLNEQYFDVNKKRKSAILEQKNLPQPSQQFIERYIEEYNKGNQIKEVMVEYVEATYEKWMENGASPVFNTLKVNSDNTINIKSAKDSWTLEELHDLLAKHEYDKGVIDWKNFIPELCNEIGYPIVEEWFETNE